MSLLTNLVRKSLNNAIYKWRKKVIFGASGLVLLIVASYFLNNYIGKIIAEKIEDVVRQMSNGLYSVSYDKMGYVINKNRFYLRNFKFEKSNDILNSPPADSLHKNYLFDAEVPWLNLDMQDYWSILFQNTLNVKGIEIDNPRIHIIKASKSQSKTKISIDAGNLYQLLSGHLEELKISDFLIKEGHFEFETLYSSNDDNFSISNLTFQVKNFQLNEQAAQRKDKFLYTDDIYLELRDQEFLLEDSVHRLSFDRFYISVINNKVGFENVKIASREVLTATNTRKDIYDISIPAIQLNGVDFIQAYNADELQIDSFRISTPQIVVIKRAPLKENKRQRTATTSQLLANHKTVNINHFGLDDAQVTFVDELDSAAKKKYLVDHVSAQLGNISIDTAKSSRFGDGFSVESIDLLIQNFSHILHDSTTSFSVEEFSISSLTDQVKIKELNVITTDKSRKKNTFKAKVPLTIVKGLDLAKAINSDTIHIDEIYIEHPEIQLSQQRESKKSGQGSSPDGLFGFYSITRNFTNLFSLQQLKVLGGRLSMANESPQLAAFSLENLELEFNNIVIDSLTDTSGTIFGPAIVNVAFGPAKFASGHTSGVTEYFTYSSEQRRLTLSNLNTQYSPGSNLHSIKASFPEIIVSGIDPDSMVFKQVFAFDTIMLQGSNQLIELSENSARGTSLVKPKSVVPPISVAHLILATSTVDVRKEGKSQFSANNLAVHIDSLIYDQSLSNSILTQIDMGKVNHLSLNNYRFIINNIQHAVTVDTIAWAELSSTFSVRGLSLNPYGKAKSKFRIDIPGITMEGLELKRMLQEGYFVSDKILIESPDIALTLPVGEQKKLTDLDLGFIPILMRNRFHGATTNMISISNAKLSYHKKTPTDSLLLDASNFNLSIHDFQLDSTTVMLSDRFLFANDIRLSGDYLSAFFPGKSDFFNVNHFSISTAEGKIDLVGLYGATNTAGKNPEATRWKFTMNKLAMDGFGFFSLTQEGHFKVADILSEKPTFLLVKNKEVPTDKPARGFPLDTALIKRFDIYRVLNLQKTISADSLVSKITGKKGSPLERKGLTLSKFPFDTALVKRLDIGQLRIENGSVSLDNIADKKPPFQLPSIQFTAGGINMLAEKMENPAKILFSDHIAAKLKNVRYALPNGLSTLEAGSVAFNSMDSTIKVHGFVLNPIPDKYAYGPAIGYQSTWLRIENDSITIKGLDLPLFLNDNRIRGRSIIAHGMNILVFRDKRLPFPEWQRKNLPQTDLKNMDISFVVDTIKLNNGYLAYQEHVEKANVPGEIFMQDLNAMIINATNDSVRILTHPKIDIAASAKIFGQGNIKANFQFDMVDSTNIHRYGVEVSPFDLTEFNRIMIPNAAVRITGGLNERILLSALANETYSYGEMKFYYEGLKIALLNRETETTKGLGAILGSFFANTFIIKSNNPSNFVLRKGDIFFIRDEKRAIFNYWTKTFLSGVVSSIGAVNNKKKLRKMEEENLKAMQKKETPDSTN